MKGCQDLLESVPDRGLVASVLASSGSLSDGKSLKVRSGLSGRSANGKTTKADDLSCKSTLSHCFTCVYADHTSVWTVFIYLLVSACFWFEFLRLEFTR